MRGACDGCLVRINGEPNVLSCLVPLEDGMEIHSQNTMGPREADLLRFADFMFPSGMNHHELFAGVPVVQDVMQAAARRIAGLGTLPKDVHASQEATRQQVDVLIVGSGAFGMYAANALVTLGKARVAEGTAALRVVVVEDTHRAGGSTNAKMGAALAPLEACRTEFFANVQSRAIELYVRTTLTGIYGEDWLAVNAAGATLFEPRLAVIATGAHDRTLAFEQNDLPGVMSARAGLMLLSQGAKLGERVLAVRAGGDLVEAVAEAWHVLGFSKDSLLVCEGPLKSVRGSSKVKGIVLEGGEELGCDTVLVDAPGEPALELANQAGLAVGPSKVGFELLADALTFAGRNGDPRSVVAIGEVAGARVTKVSLEDAAARVRELAKRTLSF